MVAATPQNSRRKEGLRSGVVSIAQPRRLLGRHRLLDRPAALDGIDRVRHGRAAARSSHRPPRRPARTAAGRAAGPGRPARTPPSPGRRGSRPRPPAGAPARRASARRAAGPGPRAPSRESTTVDCTDATAASCEPRGPGVPEAVGGGVADPLHPAGDPHLALDRVPGEDQRRPRVHRELGALRRGVAGAEDEAALVVALHQDDAGVRGAVGVRGGHDDGVRLGQLGGHDVGEPAVELLDPGGREVLLAEAAGGVVVAHPREVRHAAMLTPPGHPRAREGARRRRRAAPPVPGVSGTA